MGYLRYVFLHEWYYRVGVRVYLVEGVSSCQAGRFFYLKDVLVCIGVFVGCHLLGCQFFLWLCLIIAGLWNFEPHVVSTNRGVLRAVFADGGFR